MLVVAWWPNYSLQKWMKSSVKRDYGNGIMPLRRNGAAETSISKRLSVVRAVVNHIASEQQQGGRFIPDGRTVQGALQACVPASDNRRDINLRIGHPLHHGTGSNGRLCKATHALQTVIRDCMKMPSTRSAGAESRFGSSHDAFLLNPSRNRPTLAICSKITVSTLSTDSLYSVCVDQS